MDGLTNRQTVKPLEDVKANATNGTIFPSRGDHMGSNDVCNRYFSEFLPVRGASIITCEYVPLSMKDVVISESGR